MWFMGTAFKAPKQHQIKQWQNVAMLVQSGFHFHPNYAHMPGTIRGVSNFIARRSSSAKTTGAKLLEHIPRQKPKRRS